MGKISTVNQRVKNNKNKIKARTNWLFDKGRNALTEKRHKEDIKSKLIRFFREQKSFLWLNFLQNDLMKGNFVLVKVD